MCCSSASPRRGAAPRTERVKEIAAVTLDRLAPLDLDGLILYDIDDESDRNPSERPFPYPADNGPGPLPRRASRWLGPPDGHLPLRRQVPRGRPARLARRLRRRPGAQRLRRRRRPAPSRCAPTCAAPTPLRQEVRPDLPLGGVVIGERHTRGGDEHLRMLAKQDRGCTFFVSQVVYDVNETKNLVSDYFYECAGPGVRAAAGDLHAVAVRLAQDAGVPAVAGRRRAALAGELAPARRRPAVRVLPADGGDRPRPGRLLRASGYALRLQHRERLDPQGGDRRHRRAAPPTSPPCCVSSGAGRGRPAPR